jgi:hypothetical protein
MGFGGRFRTEIIPERVYALVKLAYYKRLTESELKLLLLPENLNTRDDVFNKVFNFALENNLIEEGPDGFILSNLDEDDLQPANNFRKFMANKLLTDENSTFFRYTSWYLAQGKKIFEHKSSNQLQKSITREDLIKLMKHDLLAWRFWAKYLGVGFLHESFVIPNAAIRIKNVILEDDNLERNKPISFNDFMGWLLEKCPEFKEGINNNNLSLGVSSGLRTLHDQDKIELREVKDASHIWHLIQSSLHEIPNDVTEIVIKEGDNIE